MRPTSSVVTESQGLSRDGPAAKWSCDTSGSELSDSRRSSSATPGWRSVTLIETPSRDRGMLPDPTIGRTTATASLKDACRFNSTDRESGGERHGCDLGQPTEGLSDLDLTGIHHLNQRRGHPCPGRELQRCGERRSPHSRHGGFSQRLREFEVRTRRRDTNPGTPVVRSVLGIDRAQRRLDARNPGQLPDPILELGERLTRPRRWSLRRKARAQAQRYSSDREHPGPPSRRPCVHSASVGFEHRSRWKGGQSDRSGGCKQTTASIAAQPDKNRKPLISQGFPLLFTGGTGGI
jgi:hypothetical protein